MAPEAAQRTAFQKYGGPDSRTVVNAEVLNIEDDSGGTSLSRRLRRMVGRVHSGSLHFFRGPGDDVFLQRFVQLDECCGEPGNAHPQILVFLLIRLCRNQLFPREIVELDMQSAGFEIRFDQKNEFFEPLFVPDG